MKPKLENIDHIHVFVPDRQEALDWYSTILGLEPIKTLLRKLIVFFTNILLYLD